VSDSDLKIQFEIARKMYPGVKRGLETEWGVFIKNKDWRTALPLLVPAIRKQMAWREWCKNSNRFAPEWKNFKTWLHKDNRGWEDELPGYDSRQSFTERNSRPVAAKSLPCVWCKRVATTKRNGEVLCGSCAKTVDERQREFDVGMGS
jgi:hypothetical protein